jgi:hypothetical protein
MVVSQCMETPYTDETRILEINRDVVDYLEWIEKTDSELRMKVHEECLRLKNVNRKVVQEPVF